MLIIAAMKFNPDIFHIQPENHLVGLSRKTGSFSDVHLNPY